MVTVSGVFVQTTLIYDTSPTPQNKVYHSTKQLLDKRESNPCNTLVPKL